MPLTLVGQTIAYIGARMLPALIAVVGVYIYTRLLDPSTVGTYALLSSIALFAAVAFNWVRVSMFRSLGSADEVGSDFARTVLVLFALTAAILVPIEAVGLTLYAHGVSRELIALTLLATVASGAFELNITLLQARRRVAMYGVMNLSRAVATLAFSVVLILLGARAEALLAGFVLGNATALFTARAWAPAWSGSFDRDLAGRLLHFGWPMSVTGALPLLSSTFDRLLLGLTAGASAIGVYAVAYDFSRQTVFLLIASTALAGQPMAIRLLDIDGLAAAQEQLKHNVRLLLAVALPSVAGLVMLSGPISRTLFGVRFRADAGFTIGLIAAATAMYGLRVFYFDQAFELSRRTRPQAAISGLAALVGVACSVILIPRLGALGAAYSAVTSNAVGVLTSIIWGGRVFELPLNAAVWLRTAIATGTMVGAILLLPLRPGLLGLAVDVAVAAVVYAGCYVLVTVPPSSLVRRLRGWAPR
jgi:O-antigen/teichoic acid export membrane protein